MEFGLEVEHKVNCKSKIIWTSLEFTKESKRCYKRFDTNKKLSYKNPYWIENIIDEITYEIRLFLPVVAGEDAENGTKSNSLDEVVGDTGSPTYPGIMAIPVVEFSREGYKIRKVLG